MQLERCKLEKSSIFLKNILLVLGCSSIQQVTDTSVELLMQFITTV